MIRNYSIPHLSIITALLAGGVGGAVVPPSATVPSDWSDSPVILLEDSVSVDLELKKRENTLNVDEIHWYKVQRNNPVVLQPIFFSYNEYIESKPGIKVVTVDAAGKSSEVSGSHIRFRRASDDPQLSNSLIMHKSGNFIIEVVVPSYDAVRYVRTEMRRRDLKPAFFGRVELRERYPVLRKTVRLSRPRRLGDCFGFSNTEAIAVDSVRQSDDKKITFTLTCSGLKALPTKPIVYRERWLAALAFRFPQAGDRCPSWLDVGDYYLNLIEPTMKGSDAIDRAVAALPSEPSQALPGAFQFVKEHTRYYGSWEGMYGFVPRSCAEVLEKGYGDCKELSMLLCTMLRAKGLDAYPALVSARPMFPQLNESFPNLGNFNHMVVAIRSGNGFRYVDPTVRFGGSDNSYYPILQRKTLVLQRGGSRIDSVVPAGNYTNAIVTSSTIAEKEPGRWRIEGTVSAFGRAAFNLEARLESRTEFSEKAILTSFLDSTFGLTGASAAVQSHCADSIRLSFSCSFDDNVMHAPQKGFVLSLPLLSKWYAREMGDFIEGPWEIPGFSQQDTWRVPAGMAKSAFHNFLSPFAQGTWSMQGAVVTRQFRAQGAVLPSVNSGECQQFATERNRFAQGTVWKE